VTSPGDETVSFGRIERAKKHSQANQGRQHDSLVPTPEGVSEDTTKDGSNKDKEGVELGGRVRWSSPRPMLQPSLTVRSAKDVG
jgi:hypothetical protein